MNTSLFVNRLRETKCMLPPLTGFTDYPYRRILADFHPPFLTTEMINARALLHKNHRTLQMITRVSGSCVQGVQLLGNDPLSMAQAAGIVEDFGFEYIDINMGCTIKKVWVRGEGVALMNDEPRACAVVEAVSDAVALPVTVKLRTGVSRNNCTVLSLSEKLVAAGAAALIIHGRSGEKKFSSPVDLAMIKAVVEHVSVPVVANGGIYRGSDAKNVLMLTGAAGVMPGRGLIGNPWLVAEIGCEISGKSFSCPTLLEKKTVCRKHVEQLCSFYGEPRGIFCMRKILPRYFSSTINLRELKCDVQHSTTKNDVMNILERIKDCGSQWWYESNCS